LLNLHFTNSAVTSLGTTESTENFNDHVWEAEDNLSWLHGRHNFKFGGQWWLQTINTLYAGNNGELGLMDFTGNSPEPQGLRRSRAMVAPISSSASTKPTVVA